MIRLIVQDLAAECFECGDGREALEAYQRCRPDWVLMDIEMKEMDGIMATREIMTAFPEAKVIIVTNYNDTDFREAARAAGALAYVVKENLLDVRRWLGDPEDGKRH